LIQEKTIKDNKISKFF